MGTNGQIDEGVVLGEFAGLSLGDVRLDRRAERMVELWSQNPSASLPKSMRTEAGLEGAYRWLNNEKVEGLKVAWPHIEATWNRASKQTWVLSLEDTTEMRFGGNDERTGLGELMNGGQGFYFHGSLVAALSDGVVTPLGVGGYEIVVRKKSREKVGWKTRVHDPDRESTRWIHLSQSVRSLAKAHETPVIHVCDREADDFAWFESALSDEGRFVVRRCKNRRLKTESPVQQYLEDAAKQARPITTREVTFQSQTTSRGRRRKPARSGRTAVLQISSTAVVLKKPDDTSATSPSLAMNLVEVCETKPPTGEKPIRWSLLTTEPVTTEEDVLRIVDAYRTRWLIEEFFKALKTGCAFERMQLESFHALHNALALCLPMAWQMLLLRAVARDKPELPAEAVLAKEQCWALNKIAANPKNDWGLKLKTNFNAGAALLGVARLGGHLKRNGTPGWQTIAHGLRVLADFITAARLLGLRCDQS